MTRIKYFTAAVICSMLSAVLLGCATVKEAAKGFAGVSTQVLEDKRKEALRESFAISYDKAYSLVNDILKEEKLDKETNLLQRSYIYAQDPQQGMIAIYLTETDTTPVGIFLSEDGKERTLIEISSPSTYAKEEIAKRIFGGIKAALKTGSQEIKTDVKQ